MKARSDTPGARGLGRRVALPAAARGVQTATRRRRRPWIPLVSGVVAVAAVVAYAVLKLVGVYAPGSTAGMSFGIAAAVMLLVVMAYSVRRGLTRVRRLGPTARYLEVHLYGGLLFVVLFLVHTDFGLPSGVLTVTLWAVSLWVVVTGVVGILLQRHLPGVLEDASSIEVHMDRIPELVDDLRERAEEVAAAANSSVRAFYERELETELQRPRTIFRLRPGRSVAQTFRSSEVDMLRRTLDEDGKEVLDELEEIHRGKADMDLHYTLQLVLRGWLLFHLPAAVLLLGLVVFHVFFVTYY